MSSQANPGTIDHVFIITGAGRGLGRSIAKVVAKRAAAANEVRHLILVGRSRRSLQVASEEAVNSHTRTYIAADVELSQPAETTTRQVLSKIGEVVEALEQPSTLRITFIQCAGTVGDLGKTVDQYTESEVADYVHLNLVSFGSLTSRFLKYAKTLTNADRIAIVNISSLLAVAAFPNWGLYAAVKAARDQLLKVAALEHKADSRIKLLSYAPGPLENDMQEQVRTSIGDPEQKEVYSGMHRDKKLVNMDFTADLMCSLLDKWEFESGAHIDVYDLLRQRQVSVLARALGQFVSLKSAVEGWSPAVPLGGHALPNTLDGGDVAVQMGMKTVMGADGRASDIYRLTASIPLDPEIRKDTQGPFSAYLSELRNWQAVLECPGIRSMWNYYLNSSTTLEMLDPHTSVTRSTLIAHLRLYGAPPRLARVGPSIAIERKDWSRRSEQETPNWEVAYSVICPANSEEMPSPNDSASTAGNSIISHIISLETASTTGATGQGHGSISHARNVSSLSSYLSNSLQRQQGEAVLGTHGGGIVRDGENFALVVTKARLGDCILEFVVDASNWHSEGYAVDLKLSVTGFSSIQQLQASIDEMHSAAPELFTQAQLDLTLEEFLSSRKSNKSPRNIHGVLQQRGSPVTSLARRHVHDRSALSELAARHLVRCFSIASQKSSRYRYLIRIMNPPMVSASDLNPDAMSLNDTASLFTQDTRATSETGTAYEAGANIPDSVYRVSVLVRKGRVSKSASVIANGHEMEIIPFSLDPELYPTRQTPSNNDAAPVKLLHVSQSDPGIASKAPTHPDAPGQAARKLFPALPENETPGISVNVGKQPNPLQRAHLAPDVNGSTEQAEGLEANSSINAVANMRATGPEVELQDVPLIRLHQASRVPASQWASLGTSASGGITLSKAEIAQPPISTAETLLDRRSSTDNDDDDDDDGEDDNEDEGSGDHSHGANGFMAMGQHGLSGVVLRAEASIVGWTIFDVFSVLASSSHGQTPVSGLWAESQPIEQVSPTTSLYHYASEGTWATAPRDAIVCNTWSSRNRGRIEVAECSVAEADIASLGPIPGVMAKNPVRAELDLSGWVLEKSTLTDVRMFGADQQSSAANESAVARMSFGLLSTRRASSASPSAGESSNHLPSRGVGHLRRDSVSGTPAMDAEFENQRRKQQAVKVVHYLKYNPRGWMHPTTTEAQTEEHDSITSAFKKFGAALGINAHDESTRASNSSSHAAALQQREKPVFPFMLPPGSVDALGRDITRIVSHLDTFGSPPTVVWSRNANILNTNATPDSFHFTYRMVPWGTPRRPNASSKSSSSSMLSSLPRNRHFRGTRRDIFLADSGNGMSALPVSPEDNEFVEVEFRIEHRVWAYGVRADGQERTSPASVELAIEPFYATSAIACFVDPEADPHATRVRIRHHRSQLLPRVEEAENAMFTAWPTVHLTIARKKHTAAASRRQREKDAKAEGAGARGEKAASSLVLPASENGAPTSALVLPWSVPPRVAVNGVGARVRYLRRDEGGRAFYARCLSVSTHDFGRQHGQLVEGNGQIAQADANGSQGELAAGDIDRQDQQGGLQIAIRNYSVLSGSEDVKSASSRIVDMPNEFATIMAGVFADVRHELELLDQTSPRAKWEQLKSQHCQSDAKSLMSLRTAAGDESWWRRRQSDDVDVYERILPILHAEIPLTVAVTVLQGVSVEQAAHIVRTAWQREKWDTALFSHRRELEYIPDAYPGPVHDGLDSMPGSQVSDDGVSEGNSWQSTRNNAGGVSINYSTVHAPVLCGKRDALTVELVECAPFLPTRKRLRNWQQQQQQQQHAEDRHRAEGCLSRLGDYADPTVTLVESSVPGSQPLSTVTRANIPLYAVRIDPIDGFERVSGRKFEYPSCRITVACCLDLCGSVPLPMRRAASARVPEAHIAQIKACARKPLAPYLVSPARHRQSGPQGSYVLSEVSHEAVDGKQLLFRRTFDGTRLLQQDFDESTRKFTAAVNLTPIQQHREGNQHLGCLRNLGYHENGAEDCPRPKQPITVVADCVVDTKLYSRGYEISAVICDATSFPSAIQPESSSIASESWISTESLVIDSCRYKLSIYVFALDDDEAKHLIRTVLLPATDSGAATIQSSSSSFECKLTIEALSDKRLGEQQQIELAGNTASESRAAVINKKNVMTISCLGQRIRVHSAQPAKQSLLFIQTNDGRFVDVCRDCGELGCKGYQRFCNSAALDGTGDDDGDNDSDNDDNGLVSFGSDYDAYDGNEDDNDCVSNSIANPKATAAPGKSKLDGQCARRTGGVAMKGGRSNSSAKHSDKRNSTASNMSSVLEPGQKHITPLLAVTAAAARMNNRNSSHGSGSDSLFSMPSALRQRKQADTADAGAVVRDGLQDLPRELHAGRPSDGSAGSRGTASGGHGAGAGAGIARAARLVLSFAAFLPLRRLVIGPSTSVEQWLEQKALASSSAPKQAAKSTVCLLLVLALGAMCAVLGMWLAERTYAQAL
ncbi:hypothetical protein GGI12_003309 [Dipsacomyces acuminosporus]|nr:hypothetical protein GGI12_003309 [Dipsacomyces acuminosporus]